MTTYRFTAFGRDISDRQDCPAGHIRFCFRVPADKAPRDIDQAVLITEDGKLGPYPAKLGTHWSDQPAGRSGYYVLVGPVPESDLPEAWQGDVAAMDAAN